MHALRWPVKRPLAAAASALFFLSASSAAQAETRSYVLSYFTQAMNSTEGDCAGGLNPKMDVQSAKNLQTLGYSGAEIEELMRSYGDDYRTWDKNKVGQLMNSRARIDGQPANAYAHPAAVPDANLKSVTGKYAYGFDLDGKGKNDPAAFEEAETHEKGIDNQMSRALGCTDPFRGTPEGGTAFWLFMWMAEKDSMPAWLLTMSGDDLSKDGPIKIKFSRAVEVPKFNGDGEARVDVTYREDPDPRLQNNLYKGEIKNGVIAVTEPGKLHMLQDQLTYPNFDLDNFHVRLTMKPDGKLAGLIGGYQSIEQVYFAIASGGHAAENNYAPEVPGIYHLLRKLADANPDATGQNWSISTAYYIKAVPAFAVPARSERSVSQR